MLNTVTNRRFLFVSSFGNLYPTWNKMMTFLSGFFGVNWDCHYSTYTFSIDFIPATFYFYWISFFSFSSQPKCPESRRNAANSKCLINIFVHHDGRMLLKIQVKGHDLRLKPESKQQPFSIVCSSSFYLLYLLSNIGQTFF